MMTAELFDMRGSKLVGHPFQGAEVMRVGPAVVRQTSKSPNPCIMDNARAYVVFKTPKGVMTMETVGSPVLVRVQREGEVQSFWIPPFQTGDREETPQDEGNLQHGRFTFDLSTLID